MTMTITQRVLQGALAFKVVALTVTLASDADNFCSTVTSCLEDGSTMCETTSGECPPCIYVLESTYTCWEKDSSTNTCPFTGVRYDCTDSWSSRTSSSDIAPSLSLVNPTESTSMDSVPRNITSTAASSTSSLSGISADPSSDMAIGGLSSSLLTYGAISFGAFLVFFILVILCARRRKMRHRREENIAATEAGNRGRNRVLSDRRLCGLTKPRDDTLSGPYNNVLDTSKVNYTVPKVNSEYSRGHRGSRPDTIDDSLSHVPTVESPRSFDGIMLADASDSPALLGNKTGSYKSGRRSTKGTPVGGGGIGKYSDVSEYVQQDVSFRCTTTPDVFGEYLRMKQEMQFDEGDGSRRKGMSFSDIISDLDSSKCSLESSESTGQQLPQQRINRDGRFSMADSFTESIADSVTDSEYADQQRVRGESDCFSEMSYNDERYSFSSVDGLDDSQVRHSKREVEI